MNYAILFKFIMNLILLIMPAIGSPRHCQLHVFEYFYMLRYNFMHLLSIIKCPFFVDVISDLVDGIFILVVKLTFEMTYHATAVNAFKPPDME